MTKTVIARVTANINGSPIITTQINKVKMETAKAEKVSHLAVLSASFCTAGLVCLAEAISAWI